MSWTEKLGLFFFLAGLAIVVFSAALPTPTDLMSYKLVTLAICGVFTALFNVHDKEDVRMIAAGGVFLLSAIVITSALSNIVVLDRLLIALSNMAFFVASMMLVQTLMIIMKIASKHESVSFGALARKHQENRISLWDSVMLIAVVIVIIMVVLEIFFDTSAYESSLLYLDTVIMILFLIDLVVLYKKSLGFKDFVRTSWADIIAVIPFGSIFRLTKLARFVKIVRIINRTRKASKVVKVPRAAKFFSEKSGFNTYLKNHKNDKNKKKGKKKK